MQNSLVVETVGAPVTFTDEGARRFAQSTYSVIRAYCERNREAFEIWLAEQEQPATENSTTGDADIFF